MNRLSQLSGQFDEEQKLQQQIIELDNWFKSPRFNNVLRPYTAKQVAEVRGQIVPNQYSDFMARKFYNLMMDLKQNNGFSLACGALDTVQVINMSKYMTSIYVSGWQCSSSASTTNDPGPDFADYPYDTVPKKCDQLVKMQRFQDRRQQYERSLITPEQRKQKKPYDYLVPVICDADAGFGGTSSVMKLTKLFIESGAAGIHLEDQRPDLKKCGHMAGRVVTSTNTHVQKLIASRLQADMMGNELFIIARTDALGARFIETNVDLIDQPYILGITKFHDKPCTYPEAGVFIIEKIIEKEKRIQATNLWLKQCEIGGIKKAKELAKKLGFELDFDWEKCRNPDGFYALQSSVHYCAIRAKEYLKYADALWMETSTPDLKVAKELSDELQFELQNNKVLCYNCSPSFNWSKFGFSDGELKNFNSELGKLGYTWQFITLAGFHLNALQSERFSKDLSERYMLAYVEDIQRKEEKHNVDQLRHQKWSGAELIDHVMTIVNQSTLISSGEDSTEHQFDNK
ncbi:unnamed protein product [Paramecium sonneborni]|uniref:Isocitrate lyase n=1 Tax=Paramecium sonneborni TaxID=65129 RepID=A0A8S1N5M7_9CILI|nr:unnamed protein product [Paramecium sonneborni]